MFAGGRRKKNFPKVNNQTKKLKKGVGCFVSMMSSNSLFNAPVGSQDVDSK